MNESVWIITEHDGRVSLYGPNLSFADKSRAERCLEHLNRFRAADRKMQIAEVVVSDAAEKYFAKALTRAE